MSEKGGRLVKTPRGEIGVFWYGYELYTKKVTDAACWNREWGYVIPREIVLQVITACAAATEYHEEWAIRRTFDLRVYHDSDVEVLDPRFWTRVPPPKKKRRGKRHRMRVPA